MKPLGHDRSRPGSCPAGGLGQGRPPGGAISRPRALRAGEPPREGTPALRHGHLLGHWPVCRGQVMDPRRSHRRGARQEAVSSAGPPLAASAEQLRRPPSHNAPPRQLLAMLHGSLIDGTDDALGDCQGSESLMASKAQLAWNGQGRGQLSGSSICPPVPQPVGQVQPFRLCLSEIPVGRNPPGKGRQWLNSPPEVSVRTLEQVEPAARP